jgi:hypothetical protein
MRANSVSFVVAAALLLAAGPSSAPAAPASPIPGASATTSTTRIAYVSGGSIYLEAGRDRGVAPGDSAEVRRDGARIAGLVVREVTSRRALCDTFAVVSMPRLGDVVRYRARAAVLPAATASAEGDSAAATAGALPARTSSGRARTWRGRVAVGFLGVTPDEGGSVRQPTVNLRLDRIGRTLNLQADVRGRSTYASGATDREARVYRLTATLHDAASRRRLTLGRQVLSAAPGAAFYAGAVAEL